MGKTLKIAAIQLDCKPAPASERLSSVTDLITEAADKGAQLVVLPELFNTGYEWHERNYANAETLEGETVTWMKAQAAKHSLHIAGTLLLRDDTDIYNAAILVAPNGDFWRYDKRYVALWERAYSKNGPGITIADTQIGKLGMLICWDEFHPDLWEQYAGNVDAMVIMSCPGDVGTGDLIFPDGFRTKFMALVDPNFDESAIEAEPENPPEEKNYHHAQAAWMGVPLVQSSATGTIHTTIPGIKPIFAGSKLVDRIEQADNMILECGFQPVTRIVNAHGKQIAQGTNTGNAVIIAEVEMPDTISKPDSAQPDMGVSPEVYHLSDVAVPAMMVPLYQEGVRRQWGSHMAPD